MKLLSFLKKKEEAEVPEVPIEVPAKAVEGSHIDPRLIVKTGKKGKTVFMKKPCVSECAGCNLKFSPTPPDEGREYCERYSCPAAIWEGFNHKGEPKTCLGVVKPKAEKEEGHKPVNPLKASKRGTGALKTPTAEVVAATNSKEARKCKKANKKKNMERRDSR